MTHRIGLLSDVHSSPVALAEALRIFADEGVDEIICAGDIAGYYEPLLPTIRLLAEANCRAIAGNHDQYWLEKNDNAGDTEIRNYLQQLPFHTSGIEWDIGADDLQTGQSPDEKTLTAMYRDLGSQISELMRLLRGEDAP